MGLIYIRVQIFKSTAFDHSDRSSSRLNKLFANRWLPFSDSPSKLTIFLIVVLPFYSDCRILLWLACHFGVRNWASAFSSIYVTYVASNTKRRKYSQCERVIFRMVQSTVGSVEKGMHTGLYTLLLNIFSICYLFGHLQSVTYIQNR